MIRNVSTSKLKRWSMTLAATPLALIALGAWLSVASEDERAGVDDMRSAPPPLPASLPAPASLRVERNDSVVGPGPNDPRERGMHPHPITAEHRRIQAENRLIQTLDDAMSIRDVKTMRALLEEYERLDPSDTEATQAGYTVIADCIEFPGGESLAAARRFYASERHSALRRFVRRICFENRN